MAKKDNIFNVSTTLSIDDNSYLQTDKLWNQYNSDREDLLTPDLLRIFKDLGSIDIISYLELQDNYYLQQDFEHLDIQDLETLYSTTNMFNNTKAVIKISNFNFQQIEFDQYPIKSYTQSVVCDNRARPDDLLRCQAPSEKLKVVETIYANKFMKSAYSADTGVFYHINADIKYNGTNIGGMLTQEINLVTEQTYSFKPNSIIQNIDNGFDTSASMLVNSWECINMTTVTRYLKNIPVPFTAVGHFKASSDGATLESNQLAFLAKQSVYAPILHNIEDVSEVYFPISGQIYVNLQVDSINYADNC